MRQPQISQQRNKMAKSLHQTYAAGFSELTSMFQATRTPPNRYSIRSDDDRFGDATPTVFIFKKILWDCLLIRRFFGVGPVTIAVGSA
jgi:hypothetical protein